MFQNNQFGPNELI